MKYLLGIPSVVRPDLLKRAVQSVEPLWPSTLIIDNSADGLDPQGWPLPILRPAVPLTFSQTMNLLYRLAEERRCDSLLFMHSDAEAGAGSPERFLTIVEEATMSGRRWGVAYTNYDALAAFNMGMMREVGPWDTVLPHYFADNDYYRRIRLARYDILETGLKVKHKVSSTIRNDRRYGFLNKVTFPLYQSYYVAKWGGPAGAETYDRPFNGKV